jgi:hypothetical protein
MADLQAMYTFAKSVDPTTGVKEGELNLIKSAGSYGDQMKLALSNLRNKRLLTDKQRIAVNEAIKNMHKNAYQQFENDIKPFISQAENAGIPKKDYLPGLEYYKTADTQQQSSTDPKVEEYAKQHGLDYAKAKSILEKRGYVSK